MAYVKGRTREHPLRQETRLASADTTQQILTKDSLHQLLAISRAPVDMPVITTIFGDNDDIKTKAAALLSELVAEGTATVNDDFYYPTERWADIAYATIGPIAADHSRVPVVIDNLPLESSLVITLSRNDINQFNLTEGSKVIIGLSHGQDIRAPIKARFIAQQEKGSTFCLTGTFNRKSNVFSALDKDIKTQFKLARVPDKFTTPRQFLAEIPCDFDIRSPVLSIASDQTIDKDSGLAISSIIASKHDIEDAHSRDILDEAQVLSRKKISLDNRVDLRALDFVTVDPPGAQDLDDAFYATIEGNGYAFYTAIADVPYIVPYNSKVDREAYDRGLTHYLANDHIVHMMPEVISTKKSSLVPGVDRAAIVVKQILGWDFRLKGFEVIPAVINSRSQLSYGQFYDLLALNDPRFKTLATIHDTRRRQGMDKKIQSMISYKTADSYATKSIVETSMVQTNSLIAEFLKKAQIPFLSRNFTGNPKAQAKNAPLQRAYYASHQLGHSSLGLVHYAHATSPIRRYADSVNLRAVHKALNTPGLAITNEEIANLDIIATHLNDRRDMDRRLMHDIDKYHAMRDLMRLQNLPVRINIDDIGRNYIDINITQAGLRQRIKASDLPDSQWKIDGSARELVLIGPDQSELRRYKRSDSLLGKLYDVDPKNAQWKVSLMPGDEKLRAVIAAPKISPK